MNLEQRKEALRGMAAFLKGEDERWLAAKRKASAQNPWFIQEFVNLAVDNIVSEYLSEEALQSLVTKYALPEENRSPKRVGIVMAGNVPLVGFHDVLCTFLTGHYAVMKPSSKDEALLKAVVDDAVEKHPEAQPYFSFAEMLRGCDAYIATGSNNSSTYFEYYFRKYPHIIRKNRTSVAVLTGNETDEELVRLSDDVYQYFGLGCRNVTKLLVPKGYNFERLLTAFRKWNWLMDHPAYKNNFDYNLAIHLLNRTYYMTNESLLLIENGALASPIAQLNYEFYEDRDAALKSVAGNEGVQCVVGNGGVAFGGAQTPAVCDFADGVDTVAFLTGL